MVAEYRERLTVLLSRAAALQHTSNILLHESSKAISQIRQSLERSRAIKDATRELLRRGGSASAR